MGKAKWRGDLKKCQNSKCPNDHEIEVMIFKGTGSCSINCNKAMGIDHVPYGQLTMLTLAEADLLQKRREDVKAHG